MPTGLRHLSPEDPLPPFAGPIDRTSITGLVLAGGRGVRMGGIDKGLVTFEGETLAARAARQLAPQVGHLLISANRHREDYQRLGPVIADEADDKHGEIPFDGPLAGILSGMRAAKTPFLACVPCDCPFFPSDLIARLSVPFADSACTLAIAYAPDSDDVKTMRAHPVFALMRITLADSLAEQLAAGERRLQSWCSRHTAVAVLFADMHAFYNMNTLQARDAAQAATLGLSPRRGS